MTTIRNAHWCWPSLALAILVGWSSCAMATATDEEPGPGLRIAPKGNKTYSVDGKMLTFNELEAELQANKPSRIVIEMSRHVDSGPCAVLLGLKLGIPVWTRSYNGRMKHLQIDVKPDELDKIDKCR
jgi:hypothetical protein